MLSYRLVYRKSLLFLIMVSMVLGSFLAAFAPKALAAEPHVDNPFVGATAYINPDYADLIDTSIAQTSDSDLAARMETVKSYPTAVWLDRIAAIHGGQANAGRKSLEDHLDLALAQKEPGVPITATIVIYDLPGRDCSALASNGELPLTQAGLDRYKAEYIDPITEVFAKPKFEDIRIVTVIEPDGLPNLVTNLSDPECAQANSSGIQVEAVQYALDELHAIPNVYIYMDIAHSGWLGWDNNLQGVVQLYTQVVQGTAAGFNSIDGFVTNVSNYTPVEEPFLPNPNLNVGGQQIRSSNYYEWNPIFDEADFTDALHNQFVNSGFPTDIGFLIDTSRNGWGGDDRPTAVSTSTNLNTYVNESKIDLREHRGLWCNVDGAGIGEPPTASPAGYANVDAFVWVKPPGESDGASEDIPNDEGKNADPNCDPTYTNGGGAGVPTGAMDNAPLAGHWFHEQFAMLVRNASPVIPTSDIGPIEVPDAPTGLTASAGDGQVSLNWSASSGATSYTVKRASSASGPYTDIANVSATSYIDTGLTNDTTYYYVVSASNSAGTSADSSSASATPSEDQEPQVPAVPTGLTIAAGDGELSLIWNSASGADSYSVKRATVSGGPYTNVANVSATSYTDTSVTNGTTYYYVVSATNSAGSSADSSEVNAMPEGSITPPTGLRVEYKAADTSATDNQMKPHLRIVNDSSSTVNLSDLTIRYWYTKDSAQADNFNCDWSGIGCANISGSFASMTSPTADADAYLEVSFSSGAGSVAAGSTSDEIQARVNRSDWSSYNESNDYSYNAAQTSFGSNDHVTLYRNGQLVYGIEPGGGTVDPDPTAPAVPAGLTASAGDGQVSLSWNASSGATSYSVKRATASGGAYTTVAANVTTTGYTDTAVTNGTTYYYVVSASNQVGESANSAQVQAQPTGTNNPAELSDDIRVNQIGYLPEADKIATVLNSSTSPLQWELRSTADNSTVLTGQTSVYGLDQASGDHVHHADFTAASVQGTYTLYVANMGESVAFEIGTDLYSNLPEEAMEYFYFHRMGAPVEGQYLTNPSFAHAALHPGDDQISCYGNWCNGDILDVRYSWADAGDFGIYAVNQAISAWTLLNLYERNPQAFPDGSLNIPESGNGIPDILDEVKFGSTFMNGMLPPSGGLASHKVHNENWSAFPLTDINAENNQARFAQPPSTNATYAVARNLAHLARVLHPYDAVYAQELWGIAEDAWSRAEANPNVDYSDTVSDSAGGGDYGDAVNSDDQYAAAVEMYLTAYALSDATDVYYLSAAASSPHYLEISDFYWGYVAGLGTLSLLAAPNNLPAADVAQLESNVLTEADGIVSTLNGEGYPSLLPGNDDYPWGSNSIIVNKMVILAYAYEVSQDEKYLKALHRAMDYMMGNNAMKLSYVTGYGEASETDTHDRWAWGKYQSGISYPKGWLSGGPMSEYSGCDSVTPYVEAAKSYAPANTAPDAWCSKENTINWNAPLAWVADFIEDTQDDLAGGTVDPTEPAAPTGVTASAGDGQVSLSWNVSTGADSYNVKRATSAGGAYTTIAANVTSTSYVDTNVTNGTTYYYVVSASNQVGESANSAQVSATPQSSITAPAVPTGVTASAGDGQVSLSWNASSGADSYSVKRATSAGGAYTTIAANVTSASYIDTNVTNGTTYYYVVSAANSAGESANSSEVSATPQGVVDPPPGDLAVQYHVGDTSATDNQMKPYMRIVNNGSSSVALSELTIRYYFSQDTAIAQSIFCDWATVGCANVQTQAVALASPVNGATHYIEVSYASGAGSLAAGANSGDLQLRIHNNDWSNFAEADDYSYDATLSSFTDWNRVTLYQDGQLVWGIEP